VWKAGKILLAMKGKLPHGDFEKYCDEHHPEISAQTRSRYMRLGEIRKAPLMGLLDLLPNQAYKLFGIITEGERERKREEWKEELKKRAARFKGLQDFKVLEGDFLEACKDLKDNSIDLVLTDPPYGEKYLPLWEGLGQAAARILKPGGFLVTYSGQLYLPNVLNMLLKHLEYYWCLAVEFSGQTAAVNGRNINNRWKPILAFYKPPLTEREMIADLVQPGGHEKDLHEWAQPLSEAQQLIQWFSMPNDLVLDPLAGSGTTLVAAFNEKRRAVGIEKDPETVKIIKGRLSELAEK
jgi:site-specific DNA-methyltransferase (adenine-specific)